MFNDRPFEILGSEIFSIVEVSEKFKYIGKTINNIFFICNKLQIKEIILNKNFNNISNINCIPFFIDFTKVKKNLKSIDDIIIVISIHSNLNYCYTNDILQYFKNINIDKYVILKNICDKHNYDGILGLENLNKEFLMYIVQNYNIEHYIFELLHKKAYPNNDYKPTYNAEFEKILNKYGTNNI